MTKTLPQLAMVFLIQLPKNFDLKCTKILSGEILVNDEIKYKIVKKMRRYNYVAVSGERKYFIESVHELEVFDETKFKRTPKEN